MCGVIGVFNSDHAAFDAMLGLFAMQNRGQESCGISVSDGQIIKHHRGMGLVKEVMPPELLESMPGKLAIGHVRYPTCGSSNVPNSQPHLLETLSGTIFSLASNGDITNYRSVRKMLENEGVGFKSYNDGELIMRFIAWCHLNKNMSVIDSITRMMETLKGAFSTVLISRDEIWCFRDPYGIRPLSWCKTETGYAFASESKGLDMMHAEAIQAVNPGEIIHVSADGKLEIIKNDAVKMRGGRKCPAHCSFEQIYFSMPDSIQYGMSVYDARKKMGNKLAGYDTELDVDFVFAAPDSSNVQALGYSQAKKIPFEMALIRNHYVGRTFTKPDQAGRDESVKQKFNPIRSIINGKKVVLVDDSIVRGTTMRKLVGMIRAAGAKEIHLRIASPEVHYPCFYGLDTNTREELLANKLNVAEMCEYLRVDSLKFLQQNDLADVIGGGEDKFCYACFDGNYPVDLADYKGEI